MKKIIGIFVVLAAIMAALRCYIVRYFVEPGSGFFVVGPQVVIFCILLVALPLLAIGVFFKSATYRKTLPKAADFFGGGALQVVMLLLVANAFLVDGVVETYLVLFRAGTSEQGVFGAVIAVLCAIYFFCELPACGRGRSMSQGMALMSLLPVLWIGARLVLAFVKYTARATIMENALDIIATVFLLLYFFAKSKCMAGINATRPLFAFGICGIFFVSVFSFPRLVFSLLGGTAAAATYIGDFGVKDALFLCMLPYIVYSMLRLDHNLSHKNLRLGDLPPPPPPENAPVPTQNDTPAKPFI